MKLSVETIDLDDTTEFGHLLSGSSPLSMLSPVNGAGLKSSPGRKQNGTVAAPGGAPGGPRAAGEEEEENEPLGELPQLRALGGARGRRPVGGARPDARRQSLAIGAMFAGLSAGVGLLGETELAVGDEEIQVPLAKSGKLLGGTANHTSLWIDPDTRDLLDAELPSPLVDGASSRDGGTADNGLQPNQGDSPVMAAPPPCAASSRRTPAMRASAAVFCDLSRACEGLGLADFNSDDFQLQDCNKVKELAILFKMQEGGSAASTPSSSIATQRSFDTQRSLDANYGTSVVAAAAAQPVGSNVAVDSGLASIRQRLQQFEASVPDVQQAKRQPVQEQAQELDGSLPAHRWQQEQHDPAPTSAAAQAPMLATAHGPPAIRTASSATRPGSGGAHSTTRAASGIATVAATKPASASRLPAASARASRLRPPTTSSGFFSSATTDGRQTARATAAASRSGPSGSGGSSRQGSAGTSRTDARASSMPRTAPAKSAIQAAERQLRVAAAATAPGGTAPGGDVATGIKQPVLSRLAQQCSSRIPTPSKPAGSRLLPSGTNTPVAAAPRPEGAGSSLAASRAPLLGSRRVPVHHESPSGSVDSANVTPNTARLRFLEQNPHLAFGCGTKLADSPDALQEAAAKKLTAEERHLLEWQKHGHL